MKKTKYRIALFAHDCQGEYKGFVKKVFFNELSGRKQINGSLHSDDAHLYASEKAAQRVVDTIKASEQEYDSIFPIEDMAVEEAV